MEFVQFQQEGELRSIMERSKVLFVNVILPFEIESVFVHHFSLNSEQDQQSERGTLREATFKSLLATSSWR